MSDVWLGPNGEVKRLVPVRRGAERVLRAVAVWGAMAAAQVEARGPVETRLRLERLRRTLESMCRIEAEAELRAERAERRKWELRLRWRARYPTDRDERWDTRWAGDRLSSRTVIGGYNWDEPIAGPRGVLP